MDIHRRLVERFFPDERHPGALIQYLSSGLSPCKAVVNNFTGPVDPPTACQWFPQVSPYHRCRTQDGKIDLSDALGTPGDNVRTLFRCRSIVHPKAHASRSRPIRFTIAANTGRGTLRGDLLRRMAESMQS
jgi:hypothetical protein